MKGSELMSYDQYEHRETDDTQEHPSVELIPYTPEIRDVQNPYEGISQVEISDSEREILNSPIDPMDIEIRPDGIIYLPEIKYRRVLNRVFGQGSWALHPREMRYVENLETRKNSFVIFRAALFIRGRYAAESTGEMAYHQSNATTTYATALEGAKSNCLMRCCKDLGVASELWDPSFIYEWKAQYAVEVWTKKIGDPKQKKPLWRRFDRPKFDYPWRENGIKTPCKQMESSNNEKPSKQIPVEKLASIAYDDSKLKSVPDDKLHDAIVAYLNAMAEGDQKVIASLYQNIFSKKDDNGEIVEKPIPKLKDASYKIQRLYLDKAVTAFKRWYEATKDETKEQKMRKEITSHAKMARENNNTGAFNEIIYDVAPGWQDKWQDIPDEYLPKIVENLREKFGQIENN